MGFLDHGRTVRRKNFAVKVGAMAFLILMTSVTAWHWLDENSPTEPVVITETAEVTELTEETAADAHFAAYRMDREEARAEELSLLTEMLADDALSEEARSDAETRRLAVAASASLEAEAEQLLDVYGFGETVVILGQTRATVIVDTDMDAEKATQIAETVDSVSGCGFENVVVVNR